MSTEPSYPGAIPPPAGVTPDLDDPPDGRRTLLFVWVIVCNALAIIFFLTRIYVKFWVTRKFLTEDVTFVIGWILLFLYSATIYVLIHYGAGRHAWDVSPDAYSHFLKWLYAGSIIYCPAAYFIKVTLLLLIARVFAVKKRVARGIYVFIFALLVAYIPIEIPKILICNPIRAFWDADVPGTCLNQRKIFIADISLAIITDIVILVMPIWLIWSLQQPLRKKFKIAVLLGAGGIATASTVFRLYLAIKFVHSTDVTYDFVGQVISV